MWGLALLQEHGLETGLDAHLIARCAPALPFGTARPVRVYIEERARNTQRAIGTTLSHEARALPPRKPYLKHLALPHKPYQMHLASPKNTLPEAPCFAPSTLPDATFLRLGCHVGGTAWHASETATIDSG
jgi:hypothetical protein